MNTNVLTKEQLQQFDRDGCLAIPNFFTSVKAQELRTAAENLLENLSLDGHPMTKFTTGTTEENKHVGDDYFLQSGNKIRYFFEEGAFNEKGDLIRQKERAINKIGHGLHMLHPLFKEFSTNKTISTIAKQLGFRSPQILQSMLIFKQPYIGGQVPSHQDSSFLYTEPLSAVGFWFALEDATVENGCLWFIPGSHKTTPIDKRFVRNPNGSGTIFIDSASQKELQQSVQNEDEKEFVKLEVKAGTLVLIHGSVVHKSGPNLSEKSRYIYTFHCIDGEAKYPKNNWLQPEDGECFTSI
ncbi:hypothetical protein BDF20DRAFT_914392 [Mycotypha africana]|uniref:uncharacterized protein n=1 Tax=Mycotypha africana TaxID=64632 RepID=UPI0023019FFA|nr:uncharacterized protein BDF20DRAFT_914392 [Mycotypha africana]KAI8975465.1 hypothetical protein BDF20DRAFT_914392 [Mycotypha africana]